MMSVRRAVALAARSASAVARRARPDGAERRRVFREIHAANTWGADESISGPGSTLDQTAVLRTSLPDVLHELRVTSMLDIPCGDWNWMSQVDLGDRHVLAADILPDLVMANKQKFPGRAEFLLLDAMRDQLPQVDLIFCRDLLVHLSYRQIAATLANLRRSGSRYLMTTTFTGSARENQDISVGGWRPLNLELPPFSLPAPNLVINERCTEGDGIFDDKSMAVWRLADVPALRATAHRR
jgi:SAM-dependent methyltransferase